MTSIDESALRSKRSFAQAIRPIATCEATNTVNTGIRQMMMLRKIRASSTMISRIVAAPTIASVLLPDSWESSCCGAAPVICTRRPVPATSGLASLRSCLAASIAGVSNPLASLVSPTTPSWTSLFSDGGWALAVEKTLPRTFSSLIRLSSALTISVTLAESAAVSLPPSVRSKTMIAPVWICDGNSSSWTCAARIDS